MRRCGERVAVILGAALAFSASGCSFFRGIPDHGGGKRFDEEQRAVAGAVRRAISGMDLSELAKKRTQIVLTNIFTSGSGTTNYSGLKNVSVSANEFDNRTKFARAVSPLNGANFTDTTKADGTGASGSLSYQPTSSYYAASQYTEGDMAYFRAALDMKARHDGIPVVDQGPEVVLYVLVDVLGTNHSRRDFLVYSREQLLASCEITYYAQRVDNGELLFKSRQTGAAAAYLEGTPLLLPLNKVNRKLGYYKPVYFDSQNVRPANGGHLDIPEQSDEMARVCRQMTNDQRTETLDALYERARALIRTGNLEAAKQSIQGIRAIDPGYKGLKDLETERKEK